MDIVDKVNPNDPPYMKLKASSSHKGPYDFDQLQHIQDLSGEHVGPIWCMKFSTCGRLLATAGQDRILRVWVMRSAYAYFQVSLIPLSPFVSYMPFSYQQILIAGNAN